MSRASTVRPRGASCSPKEWNALLELSRRTALPIFRSLEVLETLAELFVTHAVPAHLRSDNGPEFTATVMRQWLAALQVQTLFIEPGSPWENGYVESFNGKLRDELLDPAKADASGLVYCRKAFCQPGVARAAINYYRAAGRRIFSNAASATVPLGSALSFANFFRTRTSIAPNLKDPEPQIAPNLKDPEPPIGPNLKDSRT